MHARLRRLLPPSGARYELFDTSAFLLWLGLFGYVVFAPPMFVQAAVGAPLVVVSEAQLGALLCLFAGFGVVASFAGGVWTRRGYIASRIGAMFMCGNFAASLAIMAIDWALRTLEQSPLFDQPPAEPTIRAALLYVMIFGYAARRLKRDNGR